MTSRFYVIRICDHRTQKKGNIDSDKQTQGIKTPYKNKLEKRNS